MMKNRKYYIFYTNKKYRGTKFSNYIGDYIYGFTDNKKIRNEFLAYRNMDLFVLESKIISSSEVMQRFEDKYRSKKLSRFDFSDDVSLILTEDEKITINFYATKIMTKLVYERASINPEIFNDKMKIMLDNILYTWAYNFWHKDSIDNPLPESYYDIDIYPDYLKIFLNIYGDTLNLKGK